MAIAETFQAAGNSVKLVVLDTCYSDPCADMLLAHVDCVVGTSSSVHDEAARSFAIGFYGALGERESFAAAWRHGNAAISLAGLPDTERPQLKVRKGSDATQLGLVTASPPGSVEADATSRSAHTSPPAKPTPSHPNAVIKILSEQLEDARDRRRKLHDAGIATNDVDLEILNLRRQLREGGQLRAGDSLGDNRYLLVRPVGRGGFAVVWEAYDCVSEQRVALKVLHSNLAGDHLRRDRFFRGARTMMRLTHPAVVRVLEPEEEDGGFYYFGDDVHVELERHQPYTGTITIPPTGGSVSVTALLKPITGKISVNSQPGGAEIFINKQLSGRTPTTLNGIDMAIAKQLELRLEGYQPYLINLAWPSDGQITIDPKLTSVRDAAQE